MLKKAVKYFKKQIYKRKLSKRGVRIAKKVDFDNCEFGNYVNIAHHAQVGDSVIGDRTSIGRYTKIRFANIGKFCSISWDVTIGALEHPIHSLSMHAFTFRTQYGLCNKEFKIPHKTCTIGNDVWIGCGVIVISGVNIGDGAIVGAGAVVTKDVQPYEIVAGVPAKHIGWRFPEDRRNAFEELKWWNMSDEEIKENFDIFSVDIDYSDPEQPMDRIEGLLTGKSIKTDV